MARSTAKVDASQVERFADRLALASRLIEEEGDQFEEKWGDDLVDLLKDLVPVSDDPPHLRDAIEQVEPGGISFGSQSHVGQFLEKGTSKMAPRPFILPAIKRIRNPAKKDAGERAVKLIQRGR